MGDAFDAYAVRDHIGMTHFTGVILQYHLKLLRVDTCCGDFGNEHLKLTHPEAK